jgi:hypothetical protein
MDPPAEAGTRPVLIAAAAIGTAASPTVNRRARHESTWFHRVPLLLPFVADDRQRRPAPAYELIGSIAGSLRMLQARQIMRSSCALLQLQLLELRLGAGDRDMPRR